MRIHAIQTGCVRIKQAQTVGGDTACAGDTTAAATLSALKRLAAERPTIYLPTHDPESPERLSKRRLATKQPRLASRD